MMEKTKLSDLELKIMEALWRLKEGSVGQIQEFLKPEKQLAITTVSTLLKRLLDKKAVTYRKDGRQFIYQSLISEKETKTSLTNNLVEQLFGGKSSLMVNHLLEAESFEAEELEHLKKMIEEAQKNRRKNRN